MWPLGPPWLEIRYERTAEELVGNDLLLRCFQTGLVSGAALCGRSGSPLTSRRSVENRLRHSDLSLLIYLIGAALPEVAPFEARGLISVIVKIQSESRTAGAEICLLEFVELPFL